MGEIFSDSQIELLLQVRKQLPENWFARLQRLRLKPELSQRSAQLILRTDEGQFRIMLRESTVSRLDFSAILGFRRPKETRWFKLRRYNGLHPGAHKNKIEKKWLERTFHIHTATERYQRAGFEEEGFAVVSTKYADIRGALDLMIAECGFEK